MGKINKEEYFKNKTVSTPEEIDKEVIEGLQREIEEKIEEDYRFRSILIREAINKYLILYEEERVKKDLEEERKRREQAEGGFLYRLKRFWVGK